MYVKFNSDASSTNERWVSNKWIFVVVSIAVAVVVVVDVVVISVVVAVVVAAAVVAVVVTVVVVVLVVVIVVVMGYLPFVEINAGSLINTGGICQVFKQMPGSGVYY